MSKELTLEPMFESMDIEQEQKVALQEAFETAVLKKTTDLMETYVEEKVNEKVETLEEEYKEKVEGLTESLDGYLDTVVEEFVTENTPMYEAQIQDEKSKTLLELFDNMVKVVGVDMLTIQEAKDISDEDNVENKLVEAEEKISDLAEKIVEAKKEANKYLQLGIVAEISEGLTILEKAKFEKLSEMVAFDRTDAYVTKLETLKETIKDQRAEGFKDEPANLPDAAFKHEAPVDAKSAMDFNQYV